MRVLTKTKRRLRSISTVDGGGGSSTRATLEQADQVAARLRAATSASFHCRAGARVQADEFSPRVGQFLVEAMMISAMIMAAGMLLQRPLCEPPRQGRRREHRVAPLRGG